MFTVLQDAGIDHKSFVPNYTSNLVFTQIQTIHRVNQGK